MRPQPQTAYNPTWLELATRRSVVRRSIAYAIVVGAILITINHGDAVLQGDFTWRLLVKMVLTPMVPYLVSTFSSVGAMQKSLGIHGNDSQK